MSSLLQINKHQLIIILIIIAAALTRLIPHPPNFTPITAIALFGGIYMNNKILAFILPVGIMIISDLFLGFSSISYFVYGSFMVISLIGIHCKNPKILKAIALIILSSISFFIITNFGVWILGGYPKTWTGLAICYTMAIPFFKNSLMGDFFYSGIMISCYLLGRKTFLEAT